MDIHGLLLEDWASLGLCLCTHSPGKQMPVDSQGCRVPHNTLRVTVMQRITLMLASPLVVSTDLPTKTGEEDNRCSSLSNRERGGYLLCALVQSGFSHL